MKTPCDFRAAFSFDHADFIVRRSTKRCVETGTYLSRWFPETRGDPCEALLSSSTRSIPTQSRVPSRLAASLTLAAMSLGYGVVQLDVTIVNTALSSIGNSLGGGVAELQWVVSAYTIAFAAFILTAGALGDRIGAKRIFMAGFAIFTAASVACGLAPDAWTLIAARAVQGLGAAILVPNSLALLSHAYPRRQVARPRGRHLGRRREPDIDGGTAGRRQPDRAGRLALDLLCQPADRSARFVADLALCVGDHARAAARARPARASRRDRRARRVSRAPSSRAGRSAGAIRS